MANDIIEIKKRKADEIACWRVKAETLTPNTTLQIGDGITLLVVVDGQSHTVRKTSTVFSVFNPGKKSKLFGGGKPYQKWEIFAIDQSTEFEGEWGIGSSSAIPCRDNKYDVDAMAIGFGKYKYNIADYYAFVCTVLDGEKDKVSRDDIREYLRSEVTGIIKSELTSFIGKAGLEGAQAKLSEVSVKIGDNINKVLRNKGLELVNFVIEKLDYTPDHIEERKKIDKAKMSSHANKISNDMKRDDIDVEAKKVNEVVVPVIDAENGNKRVKDSPANNGSAKNNEEKKQTKDVFCTKCGGKNDSDDKFCRHCGNLLK